MKKILVLCTGNSCRSQIAEGFLKNILGNKALIASAGIEAHGVNPRAIKTMAEINIDISNHSSDIINKYKNENFDHIITVCDNAKENCPYFPAEAKRLHNNFPDPAKAKGTEEEIMNEFRKVRNMIQKFIENFIKEHIFR